MARLTGELAKCFEESNRLQEQIKKNLEAIGYGSKDIVPAQPGDIVIYQSGAGLPEVECTFHGDNMWLTQAQMMELYQVAKSTLSEHITHIFEEGELDPAAVFGNSETTAADGKNYDVSYYSLELVIAVGYRVRGNVGRNFANGQRCS